LRGTVIRDLIAIRFQSRKLSGGPNDGLELVDARIANAVSCVPPENKPLPAEINTCRQFLSAVIAEMPMLAAIVTLGRIAHESTVVTLGQRRSAGPFTHGAACEYRKAQTVHETITARATTPTPVS
jgi:uracil-DNA glycosylase family 4